VDIYFHCIEPSGLPLRPITITFNRCRQQIPKNTAMLYNSKVNADMAPIEEIDLILPFYVNGTLGAANRARIDGALEHSSELRAALIAEEEFAVKLRAAGPRVMVRQYNAEDRLRAVRGKLNVVEKPCGDASISRAVHNNLRSRLGLLGPKHWHPGKFDH
jgi:hypothetical protein